MQIETIELPTDPKTNKRRGFVFITFKEESAVKKILEKKYHNVSGSKVTNGKEDVVCICLFFRITKYECRVVKVKSIMYCFVFEKFARKSQNCEIYSRC